MRLPPLLEGTLVRRYQRFFADVRLAGGAEVVAHCPNSGTMRTCAVPGQRVLVSRADGPGRKLAFTWEVAFAGEAGDVPVLVNTARPNAVVREGIAAGAIPSLAGYARTRAEVRYGEEGSRIDLLIEDDGRPPCFVEVKNVTLLDAPGVAAFPDAVTTRGARHLRELARVVATGARGVLVFLVSRADATRVRPADAVDPAYGLALRDAARRGVEVLAVRGVVGREELRVGEALDVDI